MLKKGETNWFITILLSLTATVVGVIIEKSFSGNLKAQHYISLFSIFLAIIIVILTVGYLIHINKMIKASIQNIQKEFLALFKDKFYCSFIKSQNARHKKMIECVRNAEKQIYIFSDLAGSEEVPKPGHIEYLKTLNYILKEKKHDIEFRRIVVPNPKGQQLNNDKDIIEWVKSNKAYAEHFEIINKYHKKSLIALRNERPVGLSFLLVDGRYLFFVVEKEYKDEILVALLEGGFFFEDFGNKLTKDFKDCLDNLAIGNVVVA